MRVSHKQENLIENESFVCAQLYNHENMQNSVLFKGKALKYKIFRCCSFKYADNAI